MKENGSHVNLQKEETELKKVSRRNFLKLSVGAGLGASVIGLNAVQNPIKTSVAHAAVKLGSKHDKFPLEISNDYKRLNQKNTLFNRTSWDPVVMPLLGKFAESRNAKKEAGWTQLEYALDDAGWAINDHAAPVSQFGVRNQGLYAWEGEINSQKYKFENTDQASQTIKKASEFLGANLVGIADYDERWVYSEFYNFLDRTSSPAEFPFKPRSVIVIAVEMVYENYRTTPSVISSSATGLGYSRMVETAHKVATFLRKIGYQAIPCGNDTALSIPLAIQAGLGELGRNGLLITEKYGPRVRLCKVFTDLELKADKPITFGVREFCRVCMKCADLCPSKAISMETEPTLEGVNISNQPGVKKWYVDAEKCFGFWGENGGDCGCCIGSCPYNKLEEWHHDLTKIATLTPAKPLLKSFDDLFGYGRTYDKDAISQFWKK